MKRSISLALLVALTLVVIPRADARRARPPASEGRIKTLTFHAHIDDIGFLVYPQSCSIGQSGICAFTTTGEAEWTGDFDGTSVYRQTGHFDPATRAYQAKVWEKFESVKVAGCGTGSMMWRGTGTVTAEEQDPLSGKLIGHGKWNHVPGTGTGDLAGVVAGSITLDRIEFTPGTWENHADVTGTIVCRS